MKRCRECGDVKPLDRVGKCRWRAGCEHRQMVHEARMFELNAALARLEQPQQHWQTPPPPLVAMAEWQSECFEHMRKLMVEGETFIDGQRWYMPADQPVDGIAIETWLLPDDD